MEQRPILSHINTGLQTRVVSTRHFMLDEANGPARGSSRLQDRPVNVAAAHTSHVTYVVNV